MTKSTNIWHIPFVAAHSWMNTGLQLHQFTNFELSKLCFIDDWWIDVLFAPALDWKWRGGKYYLLCILQVCRALSVGLQIQHIYHSSVYISYYFKRIFFCHSDFPLDSTTSSHIILSNLLLLLIALMWQAFNQEFILLSHECADSRIGKPRVNRASW